MNKQKTEINKIYKVKYLVHGILKEVKSYKTEYIYTTMKLSKDLAMAHIRSLNQNYWNMELVSIELIESAETISEIEEGVKKEEIHNETKYY